jgi:hypothetical protein
MGTPIFDEPDLHHWSSPQSRVTAGRVMTAYKLWTASNFVEFCDPTCIHEFRPCQYTGRGTKILNLIDTISYPEYPTHDKS